MKKEITEHGTSMYRYRKCRCKVCRDAINEQKKKYRPKVDNVNIKLDAGTLYRVLEKDGRLWAVPHNTMHRWIKDGINIYSADAIAIKLGYHPTEIWGDAFYEGV